MKVSVVIPTYNRINLLERAVNSVIRQTKNAFEIIVVDDGSDDNSSEMVKQKFGSVILVRQENCGVSAARNRGIEISKGDWIALLDSDDEWKPNKLEKQINALSEDPDCFFCHTNETWIRNGVRVNQGKRHKKYGGYIFDKCLDICRISPSSALFKKSILEHVGLFDNELHVCEDYDLWLRITREHTILFIDEPLIIKYGGHSDQLSKNIDGIEIYRIQSLEKLLRNEKIKRDDRLLATEMLLRKLNIYYNGCIKRGKKESAEETIEKIKFWKKNIIEY